ncbi:MAG: alpha/beta hydrolase [Bacilli bacterium]|nr:alpha/beta hydrolase [Bacilli bacterium]
MINIKDTNINYILYGEKKKTTIVLLHGWGQNIEMMKMIGDAFKDRFQILILDLPGYGKSSEPPFSWSVYDYVDMLHELLSKLNIKDIILIGHSFGGKISLAYSSKYDVKKLVLFGSPFKPETEKISFKTKMLKNMKKVPVLNKLEGFAKKHIGSTDYRNATPRMREILVLTVNLDITEDVKKIKCPTLIVWGTLDEAVPIERAYELEKLIPDAGVVVYENCTHYAYLERLNQTINILNSFLGE